MNEVILQNKNGKILASSRDVAEKFGKEHSKVRRSIQALQKDVANFGEMFVQSYYEDAYGRKQEEYCMNRDGFSLIVMGFTGKKALEWKLKYIEAFNRMEEKLKASMSLTSEEQLKLQLFDKDPLRVVQAHQQLVSIEVDKATAPLIAENNEMKPKVEYYDDVLNKDGLISTTIIAKDLGLRSAAKLNHIMFLNNIIFKNKSGVWCPYADYEWIITEKYADYKSYNVQNSNPCLKWTEKGRKWIVENYQEWIHN